ncbi:MAG: hypothetical protein ACE5E5_08545 [Phycisphaerae bacterium]
MQTTLLYVRSPHQRHAGEPNPASMLDALPLPHDDCENIYRALARLCRPDGATIETVVVALDALQPEEFEFFTLARRFRPDVRILVHAHDDARHLIRMATDRGAAGELTEDILPTLRKCSESPDASQPAQPQDAPHTTTTTTEPTRNARPDADPGGPEGVLTQEPDLDLDPPTVGKADSTQDVPEQEYSAPVRVPWSRRQDAPQRIRPNADSSTHPAEEASEAEPEPPAADSEASSEPLLTQEELAALISDEPDTLPPTDYRRSSDSEAGP